MVIANTITAFAKALMFCEPFFGIQLVAFGQQQLP
jgi:hypothetical protein